MYNKHQLNKYKKIHPVKASSRKSDDDKEQQSMNFQIIPFQKLKQIFFSIIDVIHLCGRQEITLKAHDDSGPTESTENPVKMIEIYN